VRSYTDLNADAKEEMVVVVAMVRVATAVVVELVKAVVAVQQASA